MSETQEPYGDTQDREIPDPQAMHAETAERLTIARSQLIDIARRLQGEVQPDLLISSAMVLTDIAQTMHMAAHFDLAMSLEAAHGEIEKVTNHAAAQEKLLIEHDIAPADFPQCHSCERWIVGLPVETEDQITLCVSCAQELSEEKDPA